MSDAELARVLAAAMCADLAEERDFDEMYKYATQRYLAWLKETAPGK